MTHVREMWAIVMVTGKRKTKTFAPSTTTADRVALYRTSWEAALDCLETEEVVPVRVTVEIMEDRKGARRVRN